jgi:16S rRNA processing protein RimM
MPAIRRRCSPRGAGSCSRPSGCRPPPKLLKITAAREQGDGVVASAQEVPDRNAAELLKGARVFVSRASFPTADEGEYYWVDLIGLEVVNREGIVLGTVTDLLDTGPHSVLRVQPKDVPAGMSALEAERLIPFVAAYVDQVDMAQKRILVDWGADY